MTTLKKNLGWLKRLVAVMGLAALLLTPIGAPSAGDGGAGPPVPFDSSGYLDGDSTVQDTLPPSLG